MGASQSSTCTRNSTPIPTRPNKGNGEKEINKIDDSSKLQFLFTPLEPSDLLDTSSVFSLSTVDFLLPTYHFTPNKYNRKFFKSLLHSYPFTTHKFKEFTPYYLSK
jgi:hypothetical protein